jgi:hypothetical protein
MEKFMYLFRGGEPAQSPDALQANNQKWYNWIGALNEKGTFVAGEPLLPTGKQVNGKSKTVTDGPYLESKEKVGGYLVIQANNIDEAVEISKDCPIFESGGKLEVRQVQKMDM